LNRCRNTLWIVSLEIPKQKDVSWYTRRLYHFEYNTSNVKTKGFEKLCESYWGSDGEFLCITRTVKHNYILFISTVRIKLHVSVLYLWIIFRLKF
jgi:hypothetical protein